MMLKINLLHFGFACLFSNFGERMGEGGQLSIWKRMIIFGDKKGSISRRVGCKNKIVI